MRLFEADTGGAVYWIAAPSIPSAMAAMLECWKREGMDDDEIDEIKIHDITYAPRAQRLVIRSDGGNEPNLRMLDEIAVCFTPTVIACSEWP